MLLILYFEEALCDILINGIITNYNIYVFISIEI